MPKVLELNKTISYSYGSKEEFEKHQFLIDFKGWKLLSYNEETNEATYEKNVVNKEDISPHHKFELEIEDLNWMSKARAIGLLEREQEEDDRLKPIRDDAEKNGDRVIDIYEFGNYHFVKIKYRFNEVTRELYKVYIDGKRVNHLTNNPDMIMLIALSYKYEGCNTRAMEYMAKMLGIKEEED